MLCFKFLQVVSEPGSSTMGSTKFEIEKFNGKNDFGLWRLKMRALLVQQGLAEFKFKLVSKYFGEEDTDFSLLVFWNKNLPIIRSIIIIF